MPFPLLGSNSAVAGGYEIDNSLRFNDGDSAYLTKTPSSTGNRRTWTFSCWFKLSNIGTDTFSLFTTKYVNGESTDIVVSSNKIQVYSVGTSGYDFQYATSGLFRDVSAWYHIVVAVDTTQGTDSNRVKIYINGSQVTSFSTTNHPNQNFDTFQNLSGEPTYIGASDVNVLSPAITRFFDGYLSEIYMIDGTQYAASDFGETNDNGVWIPKDASGDLTFGTNGFYMEFKQTGTGTNSSGMGADTSGNDNHFAVTNLAATDVTTDTPTNNFCTMNPLMTFAGASDGIDAFSEGNTVVDSNNDTSAAGATFGVQNGKWYYEAKLTTGNQSSTNFSTGWCQVDYEGQKGTGNGVGFMSGEDNASTDVGGNIIWNNSGNGNQATFGNRSTNDIFQVALDLDNHKMWFGVNGTWSNGSASQSTTFNANSPDFSDIFDTGGVYYMPAFAQGSTGQTVLAYNFGNPSFAISSSNADANGYGNFEYAVPSGFYSLCTKNLAEYG